MITGIYLDWVDYDEDTYNDWFILQSTNGRIFGNVVGRAYVAIRVGEY